VNNIDGFPGEHRAPDPTPAAKADARSRGLRTLGQAVAASLLTFLGAVGVAIAAPDFTLDLEMLAVGGGIAVLTPVLAYLQRRSEK